MANMNSLSSELLEQRLPVGTQRCLDRSHRPELLTSSQRSSSAGKEDRSLALLDHLGDDLTVASKAASDSDVKGRVKELRVDVMSSREVGEFVSRRKRRSHVVNHDLHLAEREDLFEGGRDALHVRDIAADGGSSSSLIPYLLRYRLNHILPSSEERNVISALSKPQGQGTSQAPSGGGRDFLHGPSFVVLRPWADDDSDWLARHGSTCKRKLN
mmetsp:Transcript_12576/g.43813  ORF Transcript_12576/g.43813 Transcript_12576/m.43813 type:complete len:214 (+) Transcript_12576:2088-2729(+)